jgi:hypothetical protein
MLSELKTGYQKSFLIISLIELAVFGWFVWTMGEFTDGQEIIEDLIKCTSPVESGVPKGKQESNIELLPQSCRRHLSESD